MLMFNFSSFSFNLPGSLSDIYGTLTLSLMLLTAAANDSCEKENTSYSHEIAGLINQRTTFTRRYLNLRENKILNHTGNILKTDLVTLLFK